MIALLVLGAFAARRIDGRIGWAALLMLVGSLAMPRHIFGGDYADYRLIGSGLIAACLAISWRAPRWLLLAAAALFLVRLGVTSEAWRRNSRETAELLTALDHLPPGSRVASAVAVDSNGWRLNSFEHVGAYATVRRDALVNVHFALPGVHMLSLNGPGPHFRDPGQRLFVPAGRPVDLSRFAPVQGADYLWYVGEQPVAQLPAGAAMVFRTDHSLLARLAKPPQHR